MTDSSPFECVIGLEVHVQLATRTKLFCDCVSEFGAPPNQNICPVCTGQPGALPVLNQEALRLGALAGLAIGCTVSPVTSFDRKNYFYPDLPKGYQISQLARPLNLAGGIEIDDDAGASRRTITIDRAHMEEDAGKSTHPDNAAYSEVDLNRAGVPLLEIVSAPDLRSPAEAYRYLVELKRRLRYARVSDCDMEKGSLRCDANVSIRERGSTFLNERTEIKNLNSFRNVERAIQYEIQRQSGVIAGGGRVVQETRMWIEDCEQTATMRSKEDAHDYRYFPDPDLLPFTLTPEWIEETRGLLPQMPDQRRARYHAEFGLAPGLIEVLIAERENADFFEQTLAALSDEVDATQIANFVTGAVMKEANDRNVSLDRLRITPNALAEVVAMVSGGRISHQAAKKVLAELAEYGGEPDPVVKRLGLEQISDRGALESILDALLKEKAAAVAEYREGNKAILNSLLGAVMKATQGKANPNVVREVLLEKLGD